MDIQRGGIEAIMGPSGVGKTTILRLISGQLQPSSGSIEVNGKEVSAMSRRQLYECRKDIGVLLQNGALFMMKPFTSWNSAGRNRNFSVTSIHGLLKATA